MSEANAAMVVSVEVNVIALVTPPMAMEKLPNGFALGGLAAVFDPKDTPFSVCGPEGSVITDPGAKDGKFASQVIWLVIGPPTPKSGRSMDTV